jgi:hypothetical protein
VFVPKGVVATGPCGPICYERAKGEGIHTAASYRNARIIGDASTCVTLRREPGSLCTDPGETGGRAALGSHEADDLGCRESNGASRNVIGLQSWSSCGRGCMENCTPREESADEDAL